MLAGFNCSAELQSILELDINHLQSFIGGLISHHWKHSASNRLLRKNHSTFQDITIAVVTPSEPLLSDYEATSTALIKTGPMRDWDATKHCRKDCYFDHRAKISPCLPSSMAQWLNLIFLSSCLGLRSHHWHSWLAKNDTTAVSGQGDAGLILTEAN